MPTERPTISSSPEPKPTLKQQRYLRLLAEQTGQTFTPPKTRREASAESDRLKRRRPATAEAKHLARVERHRDRRVVSRDLATGRGDTAAVRDHEISGHGSSATWAERP